MNAAAFASFPDLQRLVELRAGDWEFGHWYDSGVLTKIVAWREWPDGSADALRVRYTNDAAGRRTDPDGGVVWEHEGTLADVVNGLLELPAPDAPSAPRLVQASTSWPWTPRSRP